MDVKELYVLVGQLYAENRRLTEYVRQLEQMLNANNEKPNVPAAQ